MELYELMEIISHNLDCNDVKLYQLIESLVFELKDKDEVKWVAEQCAEKLDCTIPEGVLD